MKISRIFALLFAVLALCAAAAGFYLSFENINADPVLVEQPPEVKEKVTELMDSVCEGDYETVSALLLGNPALGLDRDAADPVGVLFWEALEESRTYSLVGDCYATNTGVAWDVEMTSLDLSSVTANLRERSQTLLEQRVLEAEDPDEVYDENNEYREDFVMAVLYDAAEQALAEDAQQRTFTFTLNLVYTNGQWWIKPEAPLLEAVSGGILSR